MANQTLPERPADRDEAVRVVKQTIEELRPLEVAIVYDGGLAVQKMNKYFMCSMSRYFRNAFCGSFMEANARVIHLHDDFPWAVYAMLNFCKYGTYYMYPSLQQQHPHINMLDLHVHVYILADKYDFPILADYAAIAYLRIAADILALDWDRDDPACYDTTQYLPFVTYSPHDMCAAAEVSRVIYSIALLWKHTLSGRDPLCREVLDMIKVRFVPLMRLKTFVFALFRLPEFFVDLRRSFRQHGVRLALWANFETNALEVHYRVV